MLQIWEDRTPLSPCAGIYIAWLLRKTKSFKKTVVHWLQTSPNQTFRKLQQTWLSCLFTTIGYTDMRFTNTLSVQPMQKSSSKIWPNPSKWECNQRSILENVAAYTAEPHPELEENETDRSCTHESHRTWNFAAMNSLLGLLVVTGWPRKSYARIHINRQWPSDVLLLSAAPHCPR